MSLKAFHIFFIATSTLLALGFGVWGVYAYRAYGDGTFLVLGLLSLAVGAVLVVYGVRFVQRLKHVR